MFFVTGRVSGAAHSGGGGCPWYEVMHAAQSSRTAHNTRTRLRASDDERPQPK